MLRLLTWNIRALRDDCRAVVRVLRDLAPDVVCVQEAPRIFGWRGTLAWLAHDAGLVHRAGGRLNGGTVVLTRPGVPVTATRSARLTKTRGLHQRGVAAVTVGGRLCVASLHLGLDGTERALHVPQVRGVVESARTPYALVAGDVNETPGNPAWDALSGWLVDVGATRDARPTFSARAPRRRIDGVFASPQVQVVEQRVVTDHPDVTAATDHLPVLAVVEVP